MVQSVRVRLLLVIVVGITATLTAIWVAQKRFVYPTNTTSNTSSTTPSVAAPLETPAEKPVVVVASEPSSSLPVAEPSPTPPGPIPVLTLDPSYAARLNLAVPVKGVKKEQLQDTFKDARSEGRVHDAIDIIAPAGTPVIAAAEGEIIKLFESERGGITIYQLSKDKRLIFYYAHLQRYADGLMVGKTVWQGETIGYVGDTGNAGAGNYHLHFSIMITNNPKRYWEGTNINPYPLLRK